MLTLAAHLRLSKMTVSRALRNVAGVSVRTRHRVLEAARRLNYRPDPSLAVLNHYRHGKKTPAMQEKIAYVTNFTDPDNWKKNVTFARMFEGVQRRAQNFGYEVEPFWLAAPGLAPRRASQILYQRGIHGLVIGPLAQGQSTLALDWKYFCTVALGRTLAVPGITAVATNHVQAVELAWCEVVSRGYERIGLALTHHEEGRTTGSLRASFLLQQERSTLPRLPILFLPEFSTEAIAAWAREHQPDVILSSEQKHYELLSAALRRNVDFVHLNIDPSDDVAGIDQGHDIVGEHAVALLHLKLIQREIGVPARRDLLLLNGTWREGKGAWKLRTPRVH